MLVSNINFRRSLTLTLLAVVVLAFSIILMLIYQGTGQLSNNSSDSNKVSIKYHYLIAASHQQTAEQAFDKLPEFVSAHPDDMPFALGEQVYWLHLVLTNHSDEQQQRVLHADNAMLAQFSLFNIVGEQVVPANNLVDSVDSAFPHVAFILPEQSQTQYLLKVQAGGAPNIPLLFYQPQVFTDKVDASKLLFGVVIGILLVMASYNLVIYFFIKDKVYLVYVGYLLSAFVVLASVNGFGFLIFPLGFQQWLNQYSLSFHYFLVAFMLLFAIYFLQYDKRGGTLYLVGLLFTALLIALAFVSPVFSHQLQVQMFFSLQPLVYLYAITTLLMRLKQDFSWARFYLLSWLPLLIGAVIQPLVLLNFLEYSFVSRNAFLFGVVAEVILMAFALAERLRRHEVQARYEFSYHKHSGLPRKVLLEQAFNHLVSNNATAKLNIVLIKPENIDHICRYITDSQRGKLFWALAQQLNSLFAYNDAVEMLGSKDSKGDKVCILGNNALAIIVNEQKNRQSIELIVQSIQTKITEGFKLEGLSLPLCADIGVANYPEHSEHCQQLINNAFKALTLTKSKAENWAFYGDQQSYSGDYSFTLVKALKNAIEQEKLALYHQPQIDLKTMRVCGSACSIYWSHPTEGEISSETIEQIADSFGMRNLLTRWSLIQGFKQHQQVIEQGYRNHIISICISKQDLLHPSFIGFVDEALVQHHIPANNLALEIDETVFDGDITALVPAIKALSHLGITISVNNHSGNQDLISKLTHLPVKEVKLAKNVIAKYVNENNDLLAIKNVISLVKALKLEVVAQGVTKQWQQSIIQEVGGDIAQGSYYAKPVAINDYLHWLSEEVSGRSPEPISGEFIPKS